MAIDKFVRNEIDLITKLLDQTRNDKKELAQQLLSMYKGALVHRRIVKEIDIHKMVSNQLFLK